MEESFCRLGITSPLAWDDDSLLWLDNRREKLCMAFPAILDLKGSYSRVGPYFNVKDRKIVSLKNL